MTFSILFFFNISRFLCSVITSGDVNLVFKVFLSSLMPKVPIEATCILFNFNI